MADYKTIETGNTDPRGFTLVAKASGSPITVGTVNHYLKALTGANAGKWWRDSDQTWQAAETANAMTHQADGHWSRALTASPWTDGAEFLEYAKESGDLHVPVSRWLKAGYTPTANSAGRVDLGLWLGTAPLALSSQRVQTHVGAMGADVLSAAALAADAVAALQSGLATAANLMVVAGYLDTEIQSILAATSTTISDLIAALNDLSAGDVETAVSAALVAYDPPTRAEATSDKDAILTRLGTPAGASVSADVAALVAAIATVTARIGGFTGSGANTLLGVLRALARKDVTAPSDLGGTFDPATDSNQGQTDTGSAGLTAAQVWSHPGRTLDMVVAQIVEALRGSTIILTRGIYQTLTLTPLGNLEEATEIYLTAKAYPETQTDDEAILQVSLTTGLLRINGETSTAGDASLTVDDAEEGTITLALEAAAAAQLAPTQKLRYDVKAIIDGKARQLATGRCDVLADVTRAVS